MLNAAERKIVKDLYKWDGHTSIFWACETQARAESLERLVDLGILIRRRDLEHGYPGVRFAISKHCY